MDEECDDCSSLEDDQGAPETPRTIVYQGSIQGERLWRASSLPRESFLPSFWKPCKECQYFLGTWTTPSILENIARSCSPHISSTWDQWKQENGEIVPLFSTFVYKWLSLQNRSVVFWKLAGASLYLRPPDRQAIQVMAAGLTLVYTTNPPCSPYD